MQMWSVVFSSSIEGISLKDPDQIKCDKNDIDMPSSPVIVHDFKPEMTMFTIEQYILPMNETMSLPPNILKTSWQVRPSREYKKGG